MTNVLDLVQKWSAAEQQGDPTLLDGLLADRFIGVGPLGFVLNREQWLERFRNGLDNRAFTVTDPQVHDHGTSAVVVGVLDQHTTWHGQDNSGRFRITLLGTRGDDTWRLASVHIGPLQTPGQDSNLRQPGAAG
jgi:ketosteroid isomerase-like protein